MYQTDLKFSHSSEFGLIQMQISVEAIYKLLINDFVST